MQLSSWPVVGSMIGFRTAKKLVLDERCVVAGLPVAFRFGFGCGHGCFPRLLHVTAASSNEYFGNQCIRRCGGYGAGAELL